MSAVDETTLALSDNVNIPRWFLWTVSVFSSLFTLLFIPWAAWVSVTLVTVTVKIDANNSLATSIAANQSNIQGNDKRISLLESDQDDLQNDMSRVEARLNALEGRTRGNHQ